VGDINWLAVLAGTVAHQALGALWYGVIFRDTWLKAMGMNPEDVERESPGGGMAIGVVASLVSVIALALFMSWIGDWTVVSGICSGATAGIGFVAASTFMNGFYEQKKPLISALFASYYTLGLMIAGAILGAWH
jgi:MFS family permease